MIKTEVLTHRHNSTFRIKLKKEKNLVPRVQGIAAKRGLGITSLANRKPLNKVGPRTKDWRAVWRWLKPKLEAAGRTSCEFEFLPHVCGGPLDPAHSKKRREMRGTDIYDVAIACRTIHTKLDYGMNHAEMFEAVMTAINANGGPIRRAA